MIIKCPKCNKKLTKKLDEKDYRYLYKCKCGYELIVENDNSLDEARKARRRKRRKKHA